MTNTDTNCFLSDNLPGIPLSVEDYQELSQRYKEFFKTVSDGNCHDIARIELIKIDMSRCLGKNRSWSYADCECIYSLTGLSSGK